MSKLNEKIWEKYSIREETILNMGLTESSRIGTEKDERGLMNKLHGLGTRLLGGLQSRGLSRGKGV